MSDSNDSVTFVLYRYSPTVAGAAIFTVLFFASSLVHIWQSWHHRARCMIPFIIGGLFEGVGYIGRIMSHSDQKKLGPYIQQSILLLVAPPLFAATIYMVLGRMIRKLHAEQHSIIPLKWLTKIFVTGDILSFLIQSGGAGIMVKGTQDSYKTGSNVVLVGLIVQIAIFCFFVVVAVIFHKRISANPTMVSQAAYALPYRKHLFALYATSLLILVRNLVRVVEYAEGNDGYIVSHEVFLYIFDAVLMFILMVVYNVVHPGQLLQAPSNLPSISDIEIGISERENKYTGR